MTLTLPSDRRSRCAGGGAGTYASAALLTSVAVVLACLTPLVSFGQRATTNQRQTPKVVLVGDSIRLSYAPAVAMRLAGKATVVSPKQNGGDSANVLKNLSKWVLEEKPAFVHFNCGIHDTKRFTARGRFQVSPEQYEANLRKIVELIHQETDAVVLFATTTPIVDDRAAAARKERDYELLGGSVEQYNAIARRVMSELKVPINDLHLALSQPAAPMTRGELIGSDGVHLTQKGQEILSAAVADFVSKHLP